MNAYLFKKFDMNMQWLAQVTMCRPVPLYSFRDMYR